MVKKHSVELIIGAKTDVLFGPVIMFGRGSIETELYKDIAFGIPPLNQALARRIMEESICFRLFQVIKEPIEHEFSVRYCNIDYDRELAIVAELEDGGRKKMAGVVRLLVDPDRKSGELAFIVADPWQGMGIGSKMIDHMMEICRDIVGSRCRACKDIQNI